MKESDHEFWGEKEQRTVREADDGVRTAIEDLLKSNPLIGSAGMVLPPPAP